MTFDTEHHRYEEGAIPRDFLSMAPEAVRLRELIDMIGAFVVVQTVDSIDVIETLGPDAP